jgi:hypothetical protein
MKTINVNIFGILPGGEIVLSMALRNVFLDIKRDLDKILSEKEDNEEQAESIICYIPSIRSDRAIFVLLDGEANFPLDRLFRHAGLKKMISGHFAKISEAEVKFGRRFSHWYEWTEPKIDTSVHRMD